MKQRLKDLGERHEDLRHPIKSLRAAVNEVEDHEIVWRVRIPARLQVIALGVAFPFILAFSLLLGAGGLAFLVIAAVGPTWGSSTE